MTDTVQRVAAVARQVLAVASVVMGALTSTLSSIHLPPAVSGVLVAAGGVILAIEHYVGDPSTGVQTLGTAFTGELKSVEQSATDAVHTLTALGHTVTVSPVAVTPGTTTTVAAPTPPAPPAG